jgi:hypothetical protein
MIGDFIAGLAGGANGAPEQARPLFAPLHPYHEDRNIRA